MKTYLDLPYQLDVTVSECDGMALIKQDEGQNCVAIDASQVRQVITALQHFLVDVEEDEE